MINRILIISEFPLVRKFIIPTLEKLKAENDVQFDCFIVTNIKPEMEIELKIFFSNVYFNKYPSGFFARLPKLRFFQYLIGLRKIARSLPNYDIAHINFHHYYYTFITSIIRKKATKLYVTFLGSDFNEIAWYKHLANKKSISNTDAIFAENPSFLNRIIKRYKLYNSQKETGLLLFFHDSFKKFETYTDGKSKQWFKSEWTEFHKVITCGYNGTTITRHPEIIKVLLSLKEKLADYYIIFPMTYGDDSSSNRNVVKSLLLDSGLNYKLLEDYLPFEKMISLSMASDIFIHIQSRDQMSSSMLEQLAAGTLVITGKWLPYESLKKKGVHFVQIESAEDLCTTLLDVMNNIDFHLKMCKGNRAVILDITNWERNKASWYKTYNLLNR